MGSSDMDCVKGDKIDPSTPRAEPAIFLCDLDRHPGSTKVMVAKSAKQKVWLHIVHANVERQCEAEMVYEAADDAGSI